MSGPCALRPLIFMSLGVLMDNEIPQSLGRSTSESIHINTCVPLTLAVSIRSGGSPFTTSTGLFQLLRERCHADPSSKSSHSRQRPASDLMTLRKLCFKPSSASNKDTARRDIQSQTHSSQNYLIAGASIPNPATKSFLTRCRTR